MWVNQSVTYVGELEPFALSVFSVVEKLPLRTQRTLRGQKENI